MNSLIFLDSNFIINNNVSFETQPKNLTMVVDFSEVFSVSPDGNSITPKQTVQIGGVTMGPGITFSSGVSFSGIEVFKLKGKKLEVDIINGVYIIRSFYN